jgi:hypothetical protein
MADKQKLWSTNISRRSVWQGVTYAVAATPIFPERQPKLRELQAVRRTFLLHQR